MSDASTRERRRDPTVLRLVEMLLPAYPDLDPDARIAIADEVAGYVTAQIAAMPGFLRLPYRAAIAAFEWLSVARHGRPFRALDGARGAAYLARWDDAPLAPMRDFVKLIRSSALFAYFDHPAVLHRLEEERAANAPAKAHLVTNE